MQFCPIKSCSLLLLLFTLHFATNNKLSTLIIVFIVKQKEVSQRRAEHMKSIICKENRLQPLPHDESAVCKELPDWPAVQNLNIVTCNSVGATVNLIYVATYTIILKKKKMSY